MSEQDYFEQFVGDTKTLAEIMAEAIAVIKRFLVLVAEMPNSASDE